MDVLIRVYRQHNIGTTAADGRGRDRNIIIYNVRHDGMKKNTLKTATVFAKRCFFTRIIGRRTINETGAASSQCFVLCLSLALSLPQSITLTLSLSKYIICSV